MPESGKINRWIYVRWFVLRFALIAYDIIAINMAHFLALVIRFYVAEQFHSVAPYYIEAYSKYALGYTLFCLAVFSFFKLYSSIWKYAGFNDLNRILFANAICFAAHVGGTLLFAMRMPITFYCIGAALQFGLIAASRFSYRLLLVEKNKVFRNKNAEIHAMVVGTGGTAKTVVREFERENDIQTMCVLNYKETAQGSLFDGVPVINGMDNLKHAIEKYKINYVVLASASMPQEIRNQIKELCSQVNVEAQDYSGFFQSTGGHITFRSLAECATGPVEVVLHGNHQIFTDGKQALRSIVGRYMVTSIRAEADVLLIELEDYSVVQNDLNADWVRAQEKETGEAISFF